MAKIEFNEEKKYLTLKDCKVSDIVSIKERVYIIVDIRLEDNEIHLLDLINARLACISTNNRCALYTKPLRFETLAFQEYAD